MSIPDEYPTSGGDPPERIEYFSDLQLHSLWTERSRTLNEYMLREAGLFTLHQRCMAALASAEQLKRQPTDYHDGTLQHSEQVWGELTMQLNDPEYDTEYLIYIGEYRNIISLTEVRVLPWMQILDAADPEGPPILEFDRTEVALLQNQMPPDEESVYDIFLLPTPENQPKQVERLARQSEYSKWLQRVAEGVKVSAIGQGFIAERYSAN